MLLAVVSAAAVAAEVATVVAPMLPARVEALITASVVAAVIAAAGVATVIAVVLATVAAVLAPVRYVPATVIAAAGVAAVIAAVLATPAAVLAPVRYVPAIGTNCGVAPIITRSTSSCADKKLTCHETKGVAITNGAAGAAPVDACTRVIVKRGRTVCNLTPVKTQAIILALVSSAVQPTWASNVEISNHGYF